MTLAGGTAAKESDAEQAVSDDSTGLAGHPPGAVRALGANRWRPEELRSGLTLVVLTLR